MIHRLLRSLNRVFRKDPEAATAFRFQRSAIPARWTVADGRFRAGPMTGTAWEIDLDLAALTIAGVAAAVAATPGYQITAKLDPDTAARPATMLLGHSATTEGTAGQRVTLWTSPLWGVLAVFAVELLALEAAVKAAPSQMVVGTAEGRWLDEIGAYYVGARRAGESDALYGRRIIDSVKPRGNNVAIEIALEAAFGGTATVEDVTRYGAAVPNYSGNYRHDATYVHNSNPKPLYGFIRVTLKGGATTEAQVRAKVATLRAGGVALVEVVLA